MSGRIRAFDWENHPLGTIQSWPQSLKLTVRLMLNSRYAMWMGWGPEFYFFCNDAYLPTVGLKESWVLGASARKVWEEIWPDIGPRAEAVVTTGQATWDESLLLFLERSGYAEETYHTFSYSPVSDDDGSIGGMLCVVTEETLRVIGERRMALLHELAAEFTRTKAEEDLFDIIGKQFAIHNKDLPFALIYLFNAEGKRAQLVCSHGTTSGAGIAPTELALGQADPLWPLHEILNSGQTKIVHDLGKSFSQIPLGTWDKPARQAVVVPIAQQGQERPAGFLVAGINPYRPFDSSYSGFLNLLAGQIGSALANARAYEAERKRAAALSEIDRAKTAFFSNVSHEFRTPLTLLLGPLEDALNGSPVLPPQTREQLIIAQRNGTRLLKLVNTLLDFSRIEAGRADVVYEPTDLASFTTELASIFRSAIEKAGLKLIVDCQPLHEPVYVDREMWEKIVLNLISNAFKFTFEGEIEVTLGIGVVEPTSESIGIEGKQKSAILRVRDTGTGIPEAELPHLFKRFHRVKGAKGRSIEGSGIGLSLVRELVRLHRGEISVTSQLDQGTTFTVTIPTGVAHLPADRISVAHSRVSTALRTEAYLEEALRWLPDETEGGKGGKEERILSPLHPLTFSPARILLADDNADMRAYVQRLLLGEGYEVFAVTDGQEALEAANTQSFDLVLTDVMMPKLDGFGLLRALRSDARSRGWPVILLSARAGAEARIEGFEAGADDYLVKPFAARELLARVESNLKIARMHRDSLEREHSLRVEAQEAQQRLESVLSNINDQFIVLDREWRFAYVNDQVLQTTELPRERILGELIWDVFPDLAGTAFYEDLKRATTEQQTVQFEYYHPAWKRWFELRAYPSPENLTLLINEITVRKQMEEELRASESRFRMIVESARDFAIFTMGLDRRVTSWNVGAQRMLGYEEVEIIGKSADVIFTDEDLAEQIPEFEMRKALAENRAGDDRWHQRKDGSRFWASGLMMTLRDEGGRVKGLLKILRDRTEKRLSEEERERLLAREKELRLSAEEANRLKDEFLATVSHELRTPLNHILGWVTLMRQGRLSPDKNMEALTTVERSARAQNRLIEDLLDVSRVITGKLKLELQPIVFAKIVEAAIASAQPAASAKNIILVNDINPFTAGFDQKVSGDPGRLQQVVWNLLSNAIKFTPAGGSVIVRLTQTDEQIKLSVSDTGEGIAPEFLPFVFDRFRQADGSFKRKHGGLGLGLSIVRHLVELHGGEVGVESVGLLQGATFTISLPLRKENEEVRGTKPFDIVGQTGTVNAEFYPISHPSIPSLDGIRVLVVDDEMDAQQIVAEMLAVSGADVRTTGSAMEALELMRNWPPDVLVADIGMPEVDGYELIRRVRAYEKEQNRSATPALALTAYTRRDDRLQALTAGYTQHISKPVEPAELLILIASLTGRLSLPEPSA